MDNQIEKSEVIKLLRLEQNYLKDKVRNINENQKKYLNIKYIKTYNDLEKYIKNLNNADKEKIKKYSKTLKDISRIIYYVCLLFIGYNIYDKDISWTIIFSMLYLFFCGVNIAYGKIYEMASSDADKINNNEEESYSPETKINNIDNAIEFLQSLTNEEQVKYLKLKL